MTNGGFNPYVFSDWGFAIFRYPSVPQVIQDTRGKQLKRESSAKLRAASEKAMIDFIKANPKPKPEPKVEEPAFIEAAAPITAPEEELETPKESKPKIRRRIYR